MDGLKENIENLTNTKGIEDILIGISYWLAVIVVVLLIFYVCIKIYNYTQSRKIKKKPFKGRDDFLS
jgi:preprotein translocase subunit SecG